MKIAYIMTEEQGASDALLSIVATRLVARGMRLAGVVQTNSDRPDCHRCDMDVRVLPDGPKIRISQSLGKESQGCRLNPSALEEAVVEVASRLDNRTDVLVLNKFGKHEADGRGFRDLVAQALIAETPVLTAVNGMNEEAFLAFTDRFATKLPADADALVEWALSLEAKRENVRVG